MSYNCFLKVNAMVRNVPTIYNVIALAVKETSNSKLMNKIIIQEMENINQWERNCMFETRKCSVWAPDDKLSMIDFVYIITN